MKALLPFLALCALSTTLPAQVGAITLTNRVEGGIEIPYSPQAVPQTGITVEAWITYDDSQIVPGQWAHPTIIRQKVGGGGEAFFLRVQAQDQALTRLSWVIQAGFGLEWLNWDFAPGQLLSWTHVAATYDGSTQRMFINGMEVASQASVGGPLLDQLGLLHIGKGDPGSSLSHYEVWNGSLDEIRLWPFARTEEEIRSTMNLELSSLPGEVSTWNLNNTFLDSSSTLHGTPVGTTNFTPSAPPLQAFGPATIAFGAQTSSCNSDPLIGTGSGPKLGNDAFSYTCVRAVPNASGILIISFSSFATPVPIAGFDLWVNPTNSFQLPVGSGPYGVSRTTIPIAANSQYSLLQLYAQYVFLDATCPATLLSASGGLSMQIQP